MKINGIRGHFLLGWGIGYISVGLSYIIAPTPARKAAFEWLPVWDNPDQWGWIWLLAGIVATVTSFRHPDVTVNRADRWGYTSLFVPPLVWVVIYSVAAFILEAASPLATVLIYGPMAYGMIVASRMENEPQNAQR